MIDVFRQFVTELFNNFVDGKVKELEYIFV